MSQEKWGSRERLRRVVAQRHRLTSRIATFRSAWALPLAVGAATLTIMLVQAAWTAGALVAVAIQSIITAGSVAWQSHLAQSNFEVLATISTFISEVDSPEALDRVLGTLIASRPCAKGVHEPACALFDALDRELPGADFEFKRRLAEAIPKLAILNFERTLTLVHELREDMNARWVSDIRRRAVESLYTRTSGNTPILRLMNRATAEGILEPRMNDNIFTCIAVIECVHSPAWGAGKRARGSRERILSKTTDYASHHLTLEQRVALDSGIVLWSSHLAGDRVAASTRLNECLRHANRYVQVVGARGAVTLTLGSQSERLDRIVLISQNPNKYVRRVAAKEVSQDFLLQCMRTNGLRTRAEQVLLSLAGDEDRIIRTTLLDCLETAYEGPRSFRDQLLDAIVQWETDALILNRIQRTRSREP